MRDFNGQCERCGVKTGTHTMSFFNTDLICMECKDKERKHPDFEKAREAEEAACREKDFNFPGIGLPEDLKG